MNTTTISRSALSGIRFPACPFSPEERARIDTAAAELDRIDHELERVANLKAILAEVGQDFAAGRLGITEAVAMLAASDAAGRADIKTALNKFLKTRAREVAGNVGDLIEKHHAHRGDHLRKLAADLEAKERDQAAELGLHPDSFEPSETLLRLRETYRRHVADRPTSGHRERLRVILDELGDEPAPKGKSKAKS